MSVWTKIKAVPVYLPHGTAPQHYSMGRALTSVVIDKGERYGAALGFGFLKGYYMDKFVWKGQGGDLWIGAGALGLGTLLNLMSSGRSGISKHLERVGDAGISSYLNSRGAYWGMKKAGRSVQPLLPGTKEVLRGEAIGAIPPAMGGAYLTADEIARFASAR